MFVQAGRAYNPAASPSPCLLHRIWQTINCRWYFGASAENIFKGHCCSNTESNLSAETGPVHHSTVYTTHTVPLFSPPWVRGDWCMVHHGSVVKVECLHAHHICHGTFSAETGPVHHSTVHNVYYKYITPKVCGEGWVSVYTYAQAALTGWVGINHSGLWD